MTPKKTQPETETENPKTNQRTMSFGKARLMRENEELRAQLFWLTDSMDESQQEDTDKLKQRAVHPSIADFVQRLAEWGFNNCDNGYVWEAMCAVIEAGEKGDLDALIGCYIEDDNGEAEAYFAKKEASE